MRYIKINLDPIRLKGDRDDFDTLQADLYEKIQALIDTDNLSWSIDEDGEEEDED